MNRVQRVVRTESLALVVLVRRCSPIECPVRVEQRPHDRAIRGPQLDRLDLPFFVAILAALGALRRILIRARPLAKTAVFVLYGVAVAILDLRHESVIGISVEAALTRRQVRIPVGVVEIFVDGLYRVLDGLAIEPDVVFRRPPLCIHVCAGQHDSVEPGRGRIIAGVIVEKGNGVVGVRDEIASLCVRVNRVRIRRIDQEDRILAHAPKEAVPVPKGPLGRLKLGKTVGLVRDVFGIGPDMSKDRTAEG